jgi:hypothetical protein
MQERTKVACLIVRVNWARRVAPGLCTSSEGEALDAMAPMVFVLGN